MSRVLGIDPGTVSFDVCGREGDAVFLDVATSTAEVGADPAAFVDVLRAAGPVDLIVGPSGYGHPWVRAADVGPQELDVLLLPGAAAGRATVVPGMRRLLLALRDSGLPVWFAPGVVHLTTVPDHRKIDRIDMGTADKLCAAALGVWDQARRLGIPFPETSLIYVEMGGAFTAIVVVEEGTVVDGAGGTCGAMGYRALGAMDGELAYLLVGFDKDLLASGGMAWVAGRPDAAAAEVVAAAASGDERAALAVEAFAEELLKRVAGHVAATGAPREILLSGRLAQVPALREPVSARLGGFAPVRHAESFAAMASEAAQGAALIAQGLVGGGPEEELVAALRLREACGSVLDHVYVSGADALRLRYPQPRRASAPVPGGGSP